MIKEQQVTGLLNVVTRLPNSRNGNPRYLLQVGDMFFKTKPDSDLAYGITNYANKKVTATLGVYYGSLHLVHIGGETA